MWLVIDARFPVTYYVTQGQTALLAHGFKYFRSPGFKPNYLVNGYRFSGEDKVLDVRRNAS